MAIQVAIRRAEETLDFARAELRDSVDKAAREDEMSTQPADRSVKPPPGAPVAPPTDRGPELGPDTVEAFLTWAGALPVGSVQAVRDRIASVRGDAALLDRLLEELWQVPVEDAGRHRLLLSTIGELKDGRAARALAEFAWAPEERLGSVAREANDGSCGFGATTGELLQARAAEMLSHLGTPEAVEATLRIATEHPTVTVRAAAIDAHLFNHADADEEVQRLRGRVRAEDTPLVGLPRFTRGKTRADFDREVATFYERHPEHVAPLYLESDAHPRSGSEE